MRTSVRRRVVALMTIVTGLGGAAAFGLDATWAEAGPETAESYFETRSLVGSYLAGRIARDDHDTEQAAKFYSSALMRDPRSTVLLDEAFTMETTDGNWERAERLADQLVRIQPQHRMAQVMLGLAAFKEGNYDLAEEHLAASAIGPIGELSSTLAVAWVRQARGDTDGALKKLSIRNQADWAQFYLAYHRALISDVAGRIGDARVAYKQVFKKDGRTLRTALAYAHHAAHRSDRRLAQSVLREHQSNTESDQHTLVKDFLARLQQGDAIDLLIPTPEAGLAEVFYGLGEALTGEGGLTPGMLYLQMALYLEPRHPFALAALAGALEATKRYEDAITVYDRIPSDTPLITAIEIRKAFNLNSLERVDEARKTLVQLLDGQDQDSAAEKAAAQVTHGRLLADGPAESDPLSIGATRPQVRTIQTALTSLGYDAGPLDGIFGETTRQAVVEFQKKSALGVDGMAGPQTYAAIVKAAGPQAFEDQSDTVDELLVLDALGNILRARKEYAEAIKYYDRAISKIGVPNDQDWGYYYARGTCHEREKNWPAAEADLKKALSLMPEQPLVLNYLGYSWIDQGVHLKEGLKLIEKAVALKPDDGYIVDSLGWAHYKLGNIKQAVLFLERAVELRPDDPILNDHLGDALWRAGREREARFQWEQALTLSPEPDDAERIKEKLEAGLALPPGPKTAQETTNAARVNGQANGR